MHAHRCMCQKLGFACTQAQTVWKAQHTDADRLVTTARIPV